MHLKRIENLEPDQLERLIEKGGRMTVGIFEALHESMKRQIGQMLAEGLDPGTAQTLITHMVKRHAAEMIEAYATMYSLERRLQVAQAEAVINLDEDFNEVVSDNDLTSQK